ncbi:MAG: hypothetical protein ACFFCS_01145 [Candidatus Hodarchaeota archaeon]
MDDTLLKSLIESNRSVWDKDLTGKIAKKGLYEVWYIFINDLPSKEAYWIRYTLLVPRIDAKPGGTDLKGVSGLWLGHFNTNDSSKNFLVKNLHPLSLASGTKEIDGGKWSILSIKDAQMLLDGARGSITSASGKKVSWELNFSGFSEPYIHIPATGRILKLVSTFPKTTHPNIRVTGKISINGEERNIYNAPGMLTHVNGTRYGDPWVYVHCNAFKDAPDAYLEISARGKMCLFGFFDGEKKVFFNKITSLIKTSASWSLTDLSFSGKDKKYSVEGKVTLKKENLLGVEYLGPTGKKIYCYNTAVASAEVKVISRKYDTKEQEIKTYIANECAVMETIWLEPKEGLPLIRWDKEE